ncbi:DUF5695 domain-containing protein [Prolixibacter sp. NT017]|uniref:DUF5695 domain-containing protein n=1 Tax=Prolixibacter sp. NT017 TaxID=2652390 RepID=UPI00126F058F|nr:DUF5695 domain-containing protein [Prolixibacter sp. NT017]GET25595.1 hypothetical protein NT017_19240 [Prolixibacter sp. NT017]
MIKPRINRMLLIAQGVALFSLLAIGCSQAKKEKEKAGTLGLKDGFLEYTTPTINFELVKSSQTISELKSAGAEGFDFTPHDRLKSRNGDGFYHLGDITLRVKSDSSATWNTYSSASRRKPVEAFTTSDKNILAAADLKKSFPADFPLTVDRLWEKKGDHLLLRFDLKNKTDRAIEIGALGLPMIFNNDLTKKTLEQAHAENVFYDPYIGEDAGYLQVTRLNGKGPVLLVLPWKKSPFEAYRPLLDDPTPRGTTFEGFYEWTIHSKAYAEKEWKNAKQWNHPTSKVLKPGESYSVGVEFVLAKSIEHIEDALQHYQRPVAVGIPGYVIPEDVKAELFLKANAKVQEINVEPANALEVRYVSTTYAGWKKYSVQGRKWGRARLTLTYDNGTRQTINYKVIQPESELVANNGHFLMTKQWYENKDDLFGRSPSVISYDNEAHHQVTQNSRAWIAGLSDEGGAGSWLNAIMKQLVEPDPQQIARLENFVDHTIWGGIQYSQEKHKYGVRKSMFYYQPDSTPAGTYSDTINYTTWAAWPKKEAESVGRSYNYPHVTAAYWGMYRLARNYQGLVTQRSWNWYLEHAFHTAMAMVEQAPYYAQFGQMEGTVFLLVLHDLKAEGMMSEAGELEKVMKARAVHWDSLQYPFGSEMPWDSTGQEEVYMWSSYFGFTKKAVVTIDAILAYMPTIPHWAYNGNARRYWDFLYAGKLQRIERMIHHYGSELNAIPVLHEYRKEPDNLYLLRVGYGGLMGGISNITQEGFAPCAFHSYPSTLKNDGLSGDYGSGFFGYAVNTGTYIVNDQKFGWLAFGGNLEKKDDWITTEITTAAKSRIFIAPAKLWLTLDAGTFRSVSYNVKTGTVKAELDAANGFTPKAFLRVEGSNGERRNVGRFNKNSRGAYVIPLKNNPLEISL